MSLPPNFARAVDLSSLGKPKNANAAPMQGIEVTPQNLTSEILVLSRTKPVILICWSDRSAESVESTSSTEHSFCSRTYQRTNGSTF